MEYDQRMTEETQDYVSKSAESFLGLMLDINLCRKVNDQVDEENNKNTVFENIAEKEFFVDNIYDQYKIPVSAYIPKNASAKSVVVYFHGGGYRIFTRKTYKRSLCYIVEKTNTIYVSVEYRLSPEYKHPIQLQDCLSATKWILSNKSNIFNVDENVKVGVSGDSAGGNAAAYVAQELRDLLSFQILIYPWLDLTSSFDSYREFAKKQYMLPEEVFKMSIDEYITDKSLLSSSTVSPLFNKDLAGLPKCLFINAELDPLVDEGSNYHKKLQESGNQSELYIVKGSIHGFFHSYFSYKNAYLDGTNHIIGFLNNL